jgi:amino acid permease
MFKNLFKDYIYPVAVFAGGTIGVGFLSLPYITIKVGIWMMLFYFLIITAIVLLINLIFCKISLKTPDFKRFPGFVEYYLGKWPKVFTLITVVLGTFGVALVYLLVGGQFLASVFQPVLGFDTLTYILIYFLIGSIIIFFDIKIVAKIEFIIIILLLLSVISIFVGGFSQINIQNVFVDWKNSLANIFLPYGPILFALWGIGLIPEVEEMLRGDKKRLSTVISISTIIVAVFYFIFAILISGITGSQTDPTGLASLRSFLPTTLVSLSLLVEALATFVAFIMQGITLKKTIIFDLKIKHWQAFCITVCPPMILLLLGFRSFIPIISLVGGVFLGINGILILLMYKKIGGKNIIIYPLSFVFLLGLIYELIYFIKQT